MWWMVLALAAPERVERGNLVLENVPETPAALREAMGPYQSVRSAGLVDFSAGGGVFIRTRFGGTTQLHRVAEPGAAREQLTFFNEPLRGVEPSPTDADRVLLLRDTGGDEQYQVWLLQLNDRSMTRLSDGTGQVSDASWSPDGTEVVYITTTKGAERDIVWVDPNKPTSRRVLYSGEGAFEVLGWFPAIDDQILLQQYISAKHSKLHILPLKRRTLRELNPSRKPIAYGSSALSYDGRSLFVASDEKSDFLRLWRIDLKGGSKEVLTPDLQHDIDHVAISPDGKHLLYSINDDGRSKLMLKTVRDFKDAPLPVVPPGVVSNLRFDHDGEHIAFTLNRPDAPGDVYSFEQGKTELTRWTFSEVGGLSTDGFVQPHFFRYPSFDGLEIPAFVFRPAGDGPFPVVVAIHGGPEGQARPYFSSRYQYWARELGIAIVVPNVRGSVGFGRTYHQADNDLKRKDSVKDIGALLDWIDADKSLDGDKVAVFGGSYGGYMVLASMIDYADRLIGGVDIVGISDFKTFLKNTKDYRRDLRRVEYGDERIPKVARFFDEISPLRNAKSIQDPLFVIQGANDPRVPASEAEQIVAAVRRGGNEAWYMLAKDEGHGFRKKRNRDAQREAVVLFLAKIFDLEL